MTNKSSTNDNNNNCNNNNNHNDNTLCKDQKVYKTLKPYSKEVMPQSAYCTKKTGILQDYKYLYINHPIIVVIVIVVIVIIYFIF